MHTNQYGKICLSESCLVNLESNGLVVELVSRNHFQRGPMDQQSIFLHQDTLSPEQCYRQIIKYCHSRSSFTTGKQASSYPLTFRSLDKFTTSSYLLRYVAMKIQLFLFGVTPKSLNFGCLQSCGLFLDYWSCPIHFNFFLNFNFKR